MIIDAHVHLWERQNGRIEGKPVTSIGGGKSLFTGEVRQMMPPYMTDGANTVERLIANMDYARVNGAVITQEYMDGNQNEYLLEAKRRDPERIRICSLYEENPEFDWDGFDGIKICAGRLKQKLSQARSVFEKAREHDLFVSIDMAEGEQQVAELEELIHEFPEIRVAIGHFGMVTTKGWQKQIALAQYPNVSIESGGITWLFHKEFYPYPSAIDAIREAISICGIEKLMWGSDYPRTMTAITYRMSLDFVQKSKKLSDEEKRLFLGGNARKFYRFQELDPLPYIINMVE